MQDAPGPYATLTPQGVLDGLDQVGLRGDGRVLQLNSYENRVFQVFLEDDTVVVAKFYRPGRWSDAQILEEHAFALELVQAEVPVVPPLTLRQRGDPPAVDLLGEPATLARWRDEAGHSHRFAVAPRCGGRELELEDLAALRHLGRFLGRLHGVGARRLFEHRHTMDPARDAQRALDVLEHGEFVPRDLQPAWRDAGGRAADALAAAFAPGLGGAALRLHGDCHLGNVLWRHLGGDIGPHLVDLDDACNGPAVQDLWMLAAGDASTVGLQLTALLEGYEQFRDFDRRQLAWIEPLRTLRMLRHSAWIAERWTDPAFPAAFPFFGTGAYWSQQIAQLREQLETMAAPPLRV